MVWWGIGRDEEPDDVEVDPLDAGRFGAAGIVGVQPGLVEVAPRRGSVAGVAPAARISRRDGAAVRTVTWSPRSTRPCATFSSGPMCPIGDSAAIETFAIVFSLTIGVRRIDRRRSRVRELGGFVEIGWRSQVEGADSADVAGWRGSVSA